MSRTLLCLALLTVLWVTGVSAADASDDLVRKRGTYLRLVTDLPDGPLLDRWITSFDASVSLWAKFWGVPSGRLQDWSVQAFVMRDQRTFRRLGFIDPRVPDFPYGYALDDQVWVREQPSDYYTGHLLLHEGVHAVAVKLFGAAGPTWYREGVAEMLATRSGAAKDNGPAGDVGPVSDIDPVSDIGLASGPGTDIQHAVNQIPISPGATPFWGRFKRMAQSRASGDVPSIQSVLGYQPDLRGDVDVYGWSWALVSMLQAYPQYRRVLSQAAHHGRLDDSAFNTWFTQRLSGQWPVVQARWTNLVADFDYGFDWQRERIALSKRDPMWDGSPLQIQVDAAQGWQSIGVRLGRGMVLKLSATGRVILDDQPKPWISEPNGVTIQYHRGQPLGRLLARILPNVTPSTETVSLPQTLAISHGATLRIDFPCWLLLRVNDAVGRLDDNQLAYQVQIRRGN